MLRWVSQVDAAVQKSPLRAIVGSFKVPVHHDMSRSVPVPQSVARRKKFPLEAEVDSVERVGLIKSATVHNITSYEVLHASHANGRGEGLNLAEGMWILPKTSFSEGTEEVQSTMLVEVVLEQELSWLFNLLSISTRSIHGLCELLSLLVWLWGSGSMSLAWGAEWQLGILWIRVGELEWLWHCLLSTEHGISLWHLVRESTKSHSFFVEHLLIFPALS